MIQSMTGFGRAEAKSSTHALTVEISSVNRKQGEVIINLPKELSAQESPLRKKILSHISRGRLHALVDLQPIKETEAAFSIDQEKALALINAFKRLEKTSGAPLSLSASDFLKIPDLLQYNQQQPFDAFDLLESTVLDALNNLVEMRKNEGADILSEFQDRLNTITGIVAQMEKIAPTVKADYHKKLTTNLESLGLNGLEDDERIIKEVALYADRCDLSEEFSRLHSHTRKFSEYLDSSDPVGRSLDFLCQEINREFNTVGSKANNSDLAHLVVSGKTEIEKIREQVQNIE